MIKYDNLASPLLRQAVGDDPQQRIGRTAWRRVRNDPYRLGRIILRLRRLEARHRQERRRARRQMQKSTAGKFHRGGSHLLAHSITSSARARKAGGMASAST